MSIGVKRLNWIKVAYAVPLLCGLGGFASSVDAQTAPSNVVSRSTTSEHLNPQGAATANGADSANEELRQRVVAALHAQPYLDDRHITVSVNGGTVQLGGFVYGTADLVDALNTARASAGGAPVVDNNLWVYREGRNAR